MSSAKFKKIAPATTLQFLCGLAAVSAAWNKNHRVTDAVNLEPESHLSNNWHYNSCLVKKLGLFPSARRLDPASNVRLWGPLSHLARPSSSHSDQWTSQPNYLAAWFKPIEKFKSFGYNPSYVPRDWPDQNSYSWDYDPNLDPWVSGSDDSDEWDSHPNSLELQRSTSRSYFTYPRPRYWTPQTHEEMKRHRFEHYQVGPLTEAYKMRLPIAEDSGEYPYPAVKCWRTMNRHKHCSA